MPDDAAPPKCSADNLPENWNDMPMAEKRKVWLDLTPMSEQEFNGLLAGFKERQKDVPQEGTEAPDFELDVLDREKGRTGKKVRLSSLRGKPVGLIFGSYT